MSISIRLSRECCHRSTDGAKTMAKSSDKPIRNSQEFYNLPSILHP